MCGKLLSPPISCEQRLANSSLRINADKCLHRTLLLRFHLGKSLTKILSPSNLSLHSGDRFRLRSHSQDIHNFGNTSYRRDYTLIFSLVLPIRPQTLYQVNNGYSDQILCVLRCQPCPSFTTQQRTTTFRETRRLYCQQS